MPTFALSEAMTGGGSDRGVATSVHAARAAIDVFRVWEKIPCDSEDLDVGFGSAQVGDSLEKSLERGRRGAKQSGRVALCVPADCMRDVHFITREILRQGQIVCRKVQGENRKG